MPLGADAKLVLDTETIRVYYEGEQLVWLVLDNKRKRVNLMDEQLVRDLSTAMDTCDALARKTPRLAVVMFSGKPSSFFVGADVTKMYPALEAQRTQARDGVLIAHGVLNRIAKAKYPIIAAIDGPALGGGLEITLACHMRIAADNKATSLGLPETKLGLLPGAGGTVRLPRQIGVQKALGIILPGGAVNAVKAKRLGLAQVVLPGEDRFPGEHRFYGEVRRYVLTRVLGRKLRVKERQMTLQDRLMENTPFGRWMIHRVAAKQLDRTTRGKYPAQYAALDQVLKGYASSESQAARSEAEVFSKLLVTPEAKHLMALFFMLEGTKKIPRSLSNVRVPPIRKLAVLGAGVMGSGIVQLAAFRGFPVYMRDIKPDLVEKGFRTVDGLFAGLVKRRKLTKHEKDRMMARVTGGTEMGGLADADVIIEAAVEVLRIKQAILAQCEEMCPDNMIFATNTSSLPITQIAEKAARPQNVVGMHFFNPVHKMPLVEIIRGRDTSDEAVAAIYKLTLRMGKTPVVVNDGPGFATSRMVGILCAEAGRILAEGGDVAEIDRALIQWGLPMGAFRLTDETGLDIGVHVGPILEQGLGPRFKVQSGFKDLVDAGFLGKKSGKGFYRYENGKQRGLHPESQAMLRRLAPGARRKVSTTEVIDRCTLIMVNEGARMLEEKVCLSPEDLDLMMIMGLGFPPFRGGLCQYADDRGIAEVVTTLQKLERSAGPQFKCCDLLKSMAAANQVFFPNRPKAPYVERRGPRPRL